MEKFKQTSHDKQLLNIMSHECKKYINDFFIIAELTKELELINFSKIINRIIIVKLKDNEFIISPCSDLDEHD